MQSISLFMCRGPALLDIHVHASETTFPTTVHSKYFSNWKCGKNGKALGTCIVRPFHMNSRLRPDIDCYLALCATAQVLCSECVRCWSRLSAISVRRTNAFHNLYDCLQVSTWRIEFIKLLSTATHFIYFAPASENKSEPALEHMYQV